MNGKMIIVMLILEYGRERDDFSTVERWEAKEKHNKLLENSKEDNH